MVYQKKKKGKIMVKERLTRVEFMEDHVGVGGIRKVGGDKDDLVTAGNGKRDRGIRWLACCSLCEMTCVPFSLSSVLFLVLKCLVVSCNGKPWEDFLSYKSFLRWIHYCGIKAR